MIYCQIEDEDRVVQAMRVPEIWDIPGRTDFMWWGQSINGRKKVIWKGEDIIFAGTTWKPGDWFVAEIASDTGDLVFKKFSNGKFHLTFSKVV